MSDQQKPEPLKRVTTTVEPVESVPWFRQSSILLAIGTMCSGVAGIFVTLCRLHIICIDVTAEALTPGVLGLFTVVAGSIWIVKRVNQGNDPKNPLPKITAV